MRNVSVICPTYNEEKYISNCIESVLAQDYPKEKIEIIFVDGGSNDRTRELIEGYQKKHDNIKLLDNSEKIVPYAMNKGIKEANGDIIIRIDAHSSYPKNYVKILVDNLIKLNADNVGAVCLTQVLNKTNKALAIKEVLSHRFGVGNSLFRTGVDNIQEADTVPFGCFRKDVFSRFGYYDERLARNQDIELNKRIKSGGGKIFLIPDTTCTYYARENYKALAKNNYQNGLWNILTVFYTKNFKSLSIRHFIPLAFILSILVPILFVTIDILFVGLGLLSLSFYLIVMSIISIRVSISKELNFLNVLIAFITLHFSYGIGSLMGLIKLPFIKS
ncbi:MAG: glycosyltransferase family 2 protein [Labilibaculum sp.]|nr:glycosyltransferase family 2 protein [Labilibaculum sp.]MBI9059638.1 glycosyltransferase family 2 protein [Labilibaculum sp.]